MDCLAVFEAAPDYFSIFINFTLAVLFDASINKIDPVAFLIPYGILCHFSDFNLKNSEMKKRKNYYHFFVSKSCSCQLTL